MGVGSLLVVLLQIHDLSFSYRNEFVLRIFSKKTLFKILNIYFYRPDLSQWVPDNLTLNNVNLERVV